MTNSILDKILKLEPTIQTDRFCVECKTVFRTTTIENHHKCHECRQKEEFINLIKTTLKTK